jgi:hypothetical protein
LAASIHIPKTVSDREDPDGGRHNIDNNRQGRADEQATENEANTAIEIILDELDNWITGNV